jgi:transglutaminase-like putative cysteine protease
MSWRLEVNHHTGLRYSSAVNVSFNEVRMTPADASGQILIAHELKVNPAARVFSYRDYWGTAVEAFDVQEEHTKLEVVAHSIVDTPAVANRPEGLSWDYLRDQNVLETWCEFLRWSDYVDDAREDPLRADIVSQMLSLSTPRAAIDLALEEVNRRIRYASGTTSVYTTAGEAWEAGFGVCQDYTHATLALLRAAGIPARYVSGYLHPGEGAIGDTVTGESHAWVEAWDGSWWAADPTNGSDVGERHTAIGRGRDYVDVSPLKGIYSGGVSEDLGVEVTLTRLPR